MDERSRRLWAGSEADVMGYGGVAAVARATGLAISTVRKGRDEARAGARPDDVANVCQRPNKASQLRESIELPRPPARGAPRGAPRGATRRAPPAEPRTEPPAPLSDPPPPSEPFDFEPRLLSRVIFVPCNFRRSPCSRAPTVSPQPASVTVASLHLLASLDSDSNASCSG